MNLVNEIIEKENELKELYREYTNLTNKCINQECNFNHNDRKLNCSWTELVTECRDYIEEE